jgi:PEGA domain
MGAMERLVERSVRERIDLETRALARPIVASPKRLGLNADATWGLRRRISGSGAAALCGLLLWFGSDAFDGRQREVVSQPLAAQHPFGQSRPTLTGLSSETLGDASSDTRSSRRAERLERRKARKEAARAKREAARAARASRAEERREAREAKREAARERRAEAAQARREAREAKRAAREAARASGRDRYAEAAEARRAAREAKREARLAKREAARERYAAKVQARREAAEARHQAALERREEARARREAKSEAREQSDELASLGSSAAPSGGLSGFGNAGTLQVNSLPWAQVYVDGRMLGYTPQRGIVLSPGEHEVRLVNPAFRMKKTLRVQIAQGERVSRREILEE